jgi:hypothetical protein
MNTGHDFDANSTSSSSNCPNVSRYDASASKASRIVEGSMRAR